jgi:predicted DNA-binding WGR domain protein
MDETPDVTRGEQIFHCTSNDAYKFWRVMVTGNVQTVCYGRIGTAGHTQDKTFATPEEAQAATARLIAQKRAKGYYPVTETEAADVRPRRPVKRSTEQLLLSFEEIPTPATPPLKERVVAESASLTLF